MTKTMNWIAVLAGLVFIANMIHLVFVIREPNVGDVYAFDADSWCISLRYKVVEVKDGYVKLKFKSSTKVESINMLHLLYVKDKYNCKVD